MSLRSRYSPIYGKNKSTNSKKNIDNSSLNSMLWLILTSSSDKTLILLYPHQETEQLYNRLDSLLLQSSIFSNLGDAILTLVKPLVSSSPSRDSFVIEPSSLVQYQYFRSSLTYHHSNKSDLPNAFDVDGKVELSTLKLDLLQKPCQTCGYCIVDKPMPDFLTNSDHLDSSGLCDQFQSY